MKDNIIPESTGEGKRATNVRPAMYAHYYPMLKLVAADFGYALTLHGSLVTDLDLVAFPWVDNFMDHIKMIEAMGERIGYIWSRQYIISHETRKPCNRFAYKLSSGGDTFIDISVYVFRIIKSMNHE